MEWSLNFPNELDVEVEHWANPAEFTDEQIHHNFILDNRIFSISPKSGLLAPGEKVPIQLTYRHVTVGAHRLPVIFKLKNGPQPAGKSTPDLILFRP